MEFGNVVFQREGKTRVPCEKPLGAKKRTNNKPRPHWWEASDLTTSPSLLSEAEKLANALTYLKAKILVDSLADTVAKAEADTLGNTLTNVEAKILVDSITYTVAKVEAKNLGYTLGAVEVLTLAEAIAKVKAKTFGDINCHDSFERLGDTLA